MKRLIIIVTFLLAQVNLSFGLCTAIVDGGNWSDPNTWDCAGGPLDGETMVIPNGITVEVDCNCGVYNNMTIIVESGGVINIPNGKKINLDANGIIQIDVGGSLTGGNAGAKIIIGGSTIWNGSDPDLSGPVTVTTDGFLPVELIAFNAIVNDRIVEITWTTESEINNDYFLIERSTDGDVWEKVLSAKGAGTSTSIINYFEIDTKPLIGLSYYRLRQIDFNGEEAEFNIVPIEIYIRNKEVMSVFPNPVRKGEIINVSFKNLGADDEGEKEVLVVLRDIRGDEMYSKVEFVDSKEGLVAIDKTHHLTPGTYLVIASSENSLYSQRILIK